MSDEATLVEKMIDRIPAMCDWVSNFQNVQDTEPDHTAYHYGSPCPYQAVVPDLLRGKPDPRRQTAVNVMSPSRPPVEDVARALYYANRGKAPMAWDELHDNAILVQGRRAYWRQMVEIVYAAMDSVVG